MTEQIYVTVTLNFLPDQVEQFYAVQLPQLQAQTIQWPGVVSVQAFRDEADANKILFLDVFSRREAVDEYFKWRTDNGDMEMLSKMLVAPPSVSIWGAPTAPK